MQRSVTARANVITIPERFTDEEVRFGFQDFNAMCVLCHGAPGKERSEIGKGLHPPPPELDKAQQRWKSSELFWIVKYGVRMTGMPAFGPTHDDRRIWNLVAFVQQLPAITPERYKAV